MLARIILILTILLLIIKIYQYFFQKKQNTKQYKKSDRFKSVKKGDVRDADFEDM